MLLKVKKWCWAWIYMLPALCLGACGKTDEWTELGINGYVYRSGQVTAEESLYIGTLTAGSDALYFKTGDGICSLPVEEEMDLDKRRLLIADSQVVDYVLGQDGMLYYVTAEYKMSEDKQSLLADYTLIKSAGNGVQEWEKPLSGISVYLAGKCLAADGEGRVFFLSEDTLYRIDENGDVKDAAPLEDYQLPDGAQRLVCGGSGKVYYCAARYGGNDETWEIYEVTGQGTSPMKEIPGKRGMPLSSAYGLLCDSPDGIVYQYREDTSIWDPVFRWTDSYLNSSRSNSNELVQMDEDHFFALLSDSVSKGGNRNLYQLARTAVSDLPRKQVLVLASTEYISDQLKQWVGMFNRENEKYHITLELYALDEVETKLNARLVSSDPPDLVDVNGLDVVSYAEKQTFEDLTPFLEDSKVLDEDQFFDGLLESYTIGGRLVCIPKGFYIDAVFGRASEVGSKAGWTGEEIMALAEEHPDRRLLQIRDDYLVRELFGTYLCERYIDWESGECAFDSEAFLGFLEWLKVYLDRVRNQFDSTYEYMPKDCLLYMKGIMTLSGRAEYEWRLGEALTFIGYPTSDGRPYIPAETENAVCIMSHSGHKKGAWQFLEYLLSQEEGSRRNFSSRQDLFRRELEEEMTPKDYYKVLVSDGDRREILYDYMSQEQADALMEIFEALDFTPRGGTQDKVLDILVEESAAYLDGTRTAQGTAEIIQNRVKNLMQERLL